MQMVFVLFYIIYIGSINRYNGEYENGEIGCSFKLDKKGIHEQSATQTTGCTTVLYLNKDDIIEINMENESGSMINTENLNHFLGFKISY